MTDPWPEPIVFREIQDLVLTCPRVESARMLALLDPSFALATQ